MTTRDRREAAKRLRELREARGLTQAALAGHDFTKGFVSLIETGRVGLSLRAASAFAERLGLSVDELLRVPNESDRLAELTLAEAERELAQGSPEKALALIRRVRENAPPRARAFRLQGRALLALDRATEAISAFEHALESFRAAKNREGYIRTLYNLAHAQARLDRPEQALAMLLQCAETLRSGELIDRTFELEVESFLAAAYARMGDAIAAQPHLERAEAMAADVVSHDALAALYGRLAAVEQQGGRYEQALGLWRKSLHELEALGRQRQTADTWHNIAVAHLRLGAYEKARSALSRAEEIQKDVGHPRLSAWLKLTRARIAVEERRLAEAEKLAGAAAADQVASSLVRGEAHLLLGQVLSRRRAPISQIRQAFDAAQKEFAHEPAGVRARGLKLYADALSGAGDLLSAFKKSREALELVRPG